MEKKKKLLTFIRFINFQRNIFLKFVHKTFRTIKLYCLRDGIQCSNTELYSLNILFNDNFISDNQ